MAILAFPPIESADENGLLALGGDLEVESLLMAYNLGIFPWPINERYPLAWFSPDPRGILDFNNLHLSRSLKKSIKKKDWVVTFNQDFKQIIQQCSDTTNRSKKEAQGTWITKEIIDAYIKFHQAGYAYSVEVRIDNNIVGGLYGVQLGNAFSGESMFHTETDASKIAIITLMHLLNKHGVHWLDTQMVTSVIGDLGGIEISRDDFINNLNQFKNIKEVLNLNKIQPIHVETFILS